jgi:hypothetical protein
MVYINDESGGEEDWDPEEMKVLEDQEQNNDEEEHVFVMDPVADRDEHVCTHGIKPPVYTKVVAQHVVLSGLLSHLSGPAPTICAAQETMLSNMSQAFDPVELARCNDACALHQQQAREISNLHLQVRESDKELCCLRRELDEAHHSTDRAECRAEQAETELRMLRSMQSMLGMGSMGRLAPMC